jgi:hypothetical protein
LDNAWLKNLADFSRDFQSSKNAHEMIRLKIFQVCSELFHRAKDGVEVFNYYATSNKIKIYSNQLKNEMGDSGFVMSFGKVRLVVYQKEDILIAQLEQMKGYTTQPLHTATFEPCADKHGSLLWKYQGSQLFTLEYILQLFFEWIVEGHKSHGN